MLSVIGDEKMEIFGSPDQASYFLRFCTRTGKALPIAKFQGTAKKKKVDNTIAFLSFKRFLQQVFMVSLALSSNDIPSHGCDLSWTCRIQFYRNLIASVSHGDYELFGSIWCVGPTSWTTGVEFPFKRTEEDEEHLLSYAQSYADPFAAETRAVFQLRSLSVGY